MLAIVKSAASIRGPLLYNENKVEQQQALFLDAHNFLLEKNELTLHKELETFQRLAQLNERSKQKAIHISLNFAESDHLEARQLIRVADEFMRGIKFGDQPWLLYQHIDAGHPHVHIVTTNIRPDGSRIPNDLRSPNHLRKLCHRIEEKHHLTPLTPVKHVSYKFSLDKAQSYEKKQVELKMATYGRMPTSVQLENIVGYVSKRFTITSFEAYNAALSLYGVRADRGRENSPMYRSGGLYYRMIDREGKKIGAPVKASKFHEAVTMEKLRWIFTIDQAARKAKQKYDPETLRRVTSRIDMTLPTSNDSYYSLRWFAEELLDQNIRLVIPALQQRPTRQHITDRLAALLRPADDGHGLYYVDFDSNTVIRDTELGPEYTGDAILRRTGVDQDLRQLYLENKLELPKNTRRQALQPGHPDTAETRALLFRLSPQHDEFVDRQAQEYQQELRLGHYRGHLL